MLGEGESAPAFDLPGVVDGDVERVSLADSIGEEVVILAFYPGDFNPACSETESDLGDLDLFTMQKDVSVYAISADSVYSHRAFADAYDLQVPLLSDLRAEVAADYGVATEDPSAGHLVGRAVFVVGLEGDIEFAWSTDDVDRRPPTDRIRDSVDGVGAGETADDRYADGHANFVEGSSQFDVGEAAFDEEEWAAARGNFERAAEEFASAAEAFDTAIRFAEDDEKVVYFERAEEQAETFAHAAEWLAESADAFDRGEGAEGVALEEDARGPLEAARAVHDPVPPEDFPPAEDPAGGDGARTGGVSAGSSDVASLDLDLDDAIAEVEADAGAGGGTAGMAGTAGAGGGTAGTTDAGAGADAGGPAVSGGAEEGAEDIDDEELAEITAELEDDSGDEPDSIAEALGGDNGTAGGTSESASGNDDATSDDGDLELDLTDPSAGEDELLEPTEREVDDEEADG